MLLQETALYYPLRKESDVIKFPVDLLWYLSNGNRNEPNDLMKVQIRVGISSGETLPVTPFRAGKIAPWGRDVVLAKRIMDIANQDQILINTNTLEQVKQFGFNNPIYDFIDKGEIKFKHDEKVRITTIIYKSIDSGNPIIIGNEKKPNRERYQSSSLSTMNPLCYLLELVL